MKMDVIASPEMTGYFRTIENQVKQSYDLALTARQLGLDPEPEVPIPLTKNMAERVVGLISILNPKIIDTPISERIMELETQYGLLDWRVGLKIAEEVAQEKLCSFNDKLEAMEMGIRVGFAYLTLGIVSAPLEGFIGLKIKKRNDGKEYFSLQYAGPIRGAGGTAASTSVILADYVRVKMGYAPYDPMENEINRCITEIHDYHERVTNLQYLPSEEELNFMVSHLPVEIDGDPTEQIEVSNYKDLQRIETNLIRGGVALVIAEGLSQKASKLWKRLSRWGTEFGLEWNWLPEFIKLKELIHTKTEKGVGSSEKKVQPNNTFIMDLVAGRPILTHPLAEGGFRLRYGRTRVSGFSAAALHPATLMVLDKYIAIGTQLKVERPGKAATVTISEVLEGPIVRLKNGSVMDLRSPEEAKVFLPEIEEIIFLGDILFNYGDFSENGHRLVPAGYCPEWWAAELKNTIYKIFNDPTTASLELSISEERLRALLSDYFFTYPTWEEAITLSTKLPLPLHPEYTHYWKLVSGLEILDLQQWLQEGRAIIEEKKIIKIIFPYSQASRFHQGTKKVLERLGMPHLVVNNESIVLESKEAGVLLFCMNQNKEQISREEAVSKNGLDLINLLSGVTIRDKAGTFIGARMGRPEKAKMRHLTGSPQVMFPVGEEGDRLRSFQAALQAQKVRSNFPSFYCNHCQRTMIYPRCEECNGETSKRYHCHFCGDLQNEFCRHGKGLPYKITDLDINYYFTKACERLGEKIYPDLIKGIRGTSNKNHLVEHLSKGILRAKHHIYVNKDGTTRYDGTELPLTHFKPKEIGTSVEKLRTLGYIHDIHGIGLINENQILELKPQDLILPGFNSLDESAPQVLTRVAQFVDDLLLNFYKLPAHYHIQKEEDLVGHLIIGLAPHISAGMIGRIIGFSETQGLFCHPLYHASLRRDCDGDEAAIMLLMDALLNFSRQYLPEKRGAKTMDAPLVLTSLLNPAEVDDQVHGIDVAWHYPAEFYEAALDMKYPWEAKWGPEQKKIEQLSDRLGTALQYEQFGFTHPVENFNKGVLCSVYKTKLTMEDKLLGQMEIARKVRAVNIDDVAKLVIQKHFLKDIKGNLRQFSMQQFRCNKCNEKFRRPPLSGKCLKCGGKLLFTVTEGSVTKYLGPSLMLAQKYNFSPYLKQVLELTKLNVDRIFGKEREKQVGLANFIH